MAKYYLRGVMTLALIVGVALATQGKGAAQSLRVRIYFSALDKQEKPVLGLSASEFELRINGHPSSLEGFRPGLPPADRPIPFVLWILIDWNPNINADVIKHQADAAAKAFTLFNRDSVIGVKLVSDRSETLEALAHDPAGLRRAFAEVSRRRGELRAGAGDDTVEVGPAGLLGAADHAIDEMVSYSRSDPNLRDREVRRAIMILSDGNINPNYKTKTLYEKAGREGVFLYPVLVPRAGPYGSWVQDYFDLAKKTGGISSVIGALNPGSRILPLPRGDMHDSALTFNFLHLARDLNGKYSFEVDAPQQGGEFSLELKAKAKNVQIRLPRPLNLAP